MLKKILTSICLLFFLFEIPVQAQEEKSLADMSPEDYVALRLPSLETLFENAKSNPMLEIMRTNQEIEANILKKEKRAWLKFFSFGSGYSYGKAGVYSSFSDINTPLTNRYSGSAQSNYSVGASVGFSIESLLDLSPSIKRQKLKIKINSLQEQQAYETLKKEIIELYSKSISSLAILRIKVEALVFASAQYKMGENDFINGRGDAGSLNTQKSIKIAAQTEYEGIKNELNIGLLKLELITNTKIFKNNIKR